MRVGTRLFTVSPRRSLGLLTTFLGLILSPELSAQINLTVNASDDVDDGTCDVGHCSLREAITAANHDAVGGIIHFNIPGAGPHTIQPLAGLPALEGDVIIDGTSEPDFTGTPVIELDGSLTGGAHGLDLVGSQNLIRGLVINRFPWNGISINTDCTFNVVEGNFIGTDVTGTIGLGNGNAGVLIGQAANNTVGGTTPGARNLISGNIEGVTIVDPTATGNVIAGNYIGTDWSGTVAIPNNQGVLLLAPGNTVGGTAEGAGNVISGNTENGINFFGEHASENLVQGNLIGTDAAGTAALGNSQSGISIVFASANTIGGTAAGAGNVISGNGFDGVYIAGPDTEDNVILGNFIGTDLTGTTAVGNINTGVSVHTATNNIIGGTNAGSRNIISGNHIGLMFADLGAVNNKVQGNYIGTNAAGNAAIPNGDMGILIWGEDNTVGGSESGAGNVISGNTTNGISLAQGSSGTVIEGNLIGTDALGTTALANQVGVFVNASADNVIGGTSAGSRNVISGNTDTNVYAVGADASGNAIRGNFIGPDVTGTVGLEGGRGIQLIDAPDNIVGGTGSGAGNLISGNANGIRIEGASGSGNLVQGNLMGTDATGTLPLGNSGATIRLTTGASNNTIGGAAAGAGNTITSSGWMGVILLADAGTGNQILSNSIFDNGALGIELGRNSVTLNDEGDADTGPNNLQNYPVLTSVVANGGAAVQAALNSSPNSSYTLDFFSNTECDPTGYGEGKTPLGTAALTTDASGNGTVAASFASITGTILTATATDANGNTSEFSECGELTTLEVSPSPATRTVTPGQSATYTITATAQGGTFEETVALTCSGAPSGTTCTFQADELDLSPGQASTTMTVTTVAPASSVLVAPRSIPWGPPGWSWAIPLALAGGAVLLRGIRRPGPDERKRRAGGLIAPRARWGAWACLGAILVVLAASCGKDGTSPPSGGTPAGSYELTVTAAWESVNQTTTATLVVQ